MGKCPGVRVLLPTLWLLFIKPKLWSSNQIQNLEPTPLWIQNKTISLSKAWLTQIQNAVLSDSFARCEFKNSFSPSIKLFELFLCRQHLPSSNSECHYPTSEKLQNNFRRRKGPRLISLNFISVQIYGHAETLLYFGIIADCMVLFWSFVFLQECHHGFKNIWWTTSLLTCLARHYGKMDVKGSQGLKAYQNFWT